MGSQYGPLVDLWMAVVFSSKLGLVSKLFLNPVGQKCQVHLLEMVVMAQMYSAP